MKTILRGLCCFTLLLVLAFTSEVFAQNTGTLTGTVKDPSGAVLPGVGIKTVNAGTNAERTAITDERGDYTISSVPIGTYSITAELPGFKTGVAENIKLNVNDKLRIDFSLQIGQVSEKLIVTEAAPLVQSETSSVGNVIDNQKVVELPLNGRQFESLSQLVPGALSPAPGSALGFRGGFNSAGARETSNTIILDGVDNNDPAINNFTLRPIVDAIQEFKVLSNSYSAEFGRGGGAQVTVSTKSGTNEFHGAVWEFLRNDKLDARDFFNTSTKQPFHRNQYGATIGGPIMKDKSFFFFAYEGIKRRQTFTSLQQAPSVPFRSGDFSSVAAPLRNPFAPTSSNFPNNQIPSSLISSVAAKVIARGSYPLPTPGLTGSSNFRANNAFPDDVNQYSARVDHRISSSNTLFGRYGFTKDQLGTPCSGNGATACLPGFPHSDITRAHALSLVDTHVFTPQFVMEARAGFNRQLQPRIALTSGNKDISSELGVPASKDPKDFGHPSFMITGVSAIGDRGFQNRAGTTYQVSNMFTYNAGSHAVRSGVELRRIQFFAGSNARETFRFDGRWTTQPGVPPTAANAFADFLLGLPSQTDRDPTDSFRYHTVDSYDGFFQDDFKVSNRLTLNLGLRYEFNTPDVEKRNRVAQLNVKTFVYEIGGLNATSRALYNSDKNNFGPRFGFAFRPDGSGKTVVRGGYGIFYDLAVVGNNLFFVRTGPPFQKPETFSAGTAANDLTMADPFPSTRLSASPIFSAPSMDPDFRDAYVQQWNLGYQSEMGSNMVYEVSYVGNKGTRLVKSIDINQAFPGPGTVQSRRPLPQYSAVSVLQSSGSSIYHGLLGRLERRFSNGLSFLSSYTYGHVIDDSTGGNVAQDARNQKADRGSADFDARQRLVVSYVYDLPFGKGNAVLGGWQVAGITTFQSGRPIFVQLSGQISNTGSTRDRPNLASGGEPVIKNRTSKTVYLDRTAFSIPAAGTFGTAGRNFFDGPGTNNWDLTLGKNFTTEVVKIQFRAEFFNALNHPFLNQPNRNPDNPAFGTITSTLRDSRQIQFGLKLIY